MFFLTFLHGKVKKTLVEICVDKLLQLKLSHPGLYIFPLISVHGLPKTDCTPVSDILKEYAMDKINSS